MDSDETVPTLFVGKNSKKIHRQRKQTTFVVIGALRVEDLNNSNLSNLIGDIAKVKLLAQCLSRAG